MTILATEPSTVLVGDDELVVEHLRITDPDAVAFVASSDDPELALVRCVEMGARVLRLANATVDTQVVEHRFDQMTQTLDRSVDDLARRIDNSARALLDDDTGELTAALRAWLTDVTATLGATFDENSKKSAIAKLEKLLETARGEQVAAVRRLLDPDSDDSPLNRWRTEIVGEVRDRGEALERLVNDLSFASASTRARPRRSTEPQSRDSTSRTSSTRRSSRSRLRFRTSRHRSATTSAPPRRRWATSRSTSIRHSRRVRPDSSSSARTARWRSRRRSTSSTSRLQTATPRPA